MRTRAAALSISTLMMTMTAAVAADPLPRVAPEAVGFSSERLALIGQTLRADVERGKLPGMVVAVARHGKLAYFEAVGFRDKVAGVPMTTDTIFSIASMTKPMTTVGAMMLVEQSRLLLHDPVGVYLPALAKMQVAVQSEANWKGVGSLDHTVPPARPTSIQDLMRHTSGLTYGGRGVSVVHKMYPASSSSAASMTGREFIEKLGTLPLLYQPGTTWDYSLSVDVLGQVVEAISEQTLGGYLQEHLWTPLGMTDTGFMVPPEKASRYARALPVDPDSGKPQTMRDSTKPDKFECGGGCGVSTAGDYVRFAQMLLNKGHLGETRILGRKTVQLMTSNHLGPEVQNKITKTSSVLEGYGFGLGGAVRMHDGIAPLMGSAGEFTWGGAYGTNFWIDPKEDLAVIIMAHIPGSRELRTHYRQAINALVYEAMTD